MSVNENPAPLAGGKPGHQNDFAGAEIKSNNSTVHHTEQSQPSDSSQSRMCKIPLVSGGNAFVNIADWHLVKEYNWWRGGTKNRYAVAKSNGLTVYMHRLIMAAGPDDIVDHIDGEPLNCCRTNLRFVTKSQNSANLSTSRNPSGYRGVCFFPAKRKFQARVMKDHKSFRGPYRETAEEAAHDFDALARGLFGEYASYNFPQQNERGVKAIGGAV